LAKTVTPGGSPRREPGRAGWFLPGGFSRKAGPIKHQLVLVYQYGGPARKNQSKPIAYTDLLAVVIYLFRFLALPLQQYPFYSSYRKVSL
jgi:hypothetical protein